MTEIPVAAFIVHVAGTALLPPGLPEERCVLTVEARDNLPKGTITICADDCHAVADGNGGFYDVGLDGSFPAEQSVILPAYIIAGPGLPVLIPDGGAVIATQAEVEPLCIEFHAVDASGSLFRWDDTWESFGTFA